jgi:hypothetical protein
VAESVIQELNNALTEQYQKCFNMQYDMEGTESNFRTDSICPLFMQETEKRSITKILVKCIVFRFLCYNYNY